MFYQILSRFDVALEHVAQAKKKSVKHVASAAAKVNKHGRCRARGLNRGPIGFREGWSSLVVG